MPSEKRGRLVFLYNGSTYVRKGINFGDPGARLRDEVMGELFLMCKTLDLKIFSLATEDGTWPLEEDAAGVLGHEIMYSRSIASLFLNTMTEGHVHFRVEATTSSLLWSSTVSPSPTSLAVTLPKERFPLSLFAEHRLQLNAVLAKKDALLKAQRQRKSMGKRKRYDESEDYGIASSSIEWGDVENIYEPCMQEDKAAFPVKELDDILIEKLVTMLRDERKAFGSAKRTTSVRRLQRSIATIFGAVITLFEENFTMKMEPLLTNDLVFTSGNPDLLVSRTQRKVVVNVCLHENQPQAEAENLLLMDVMIAENEEKNWREAPVFGVVSTFSDWVFYKYDETGIKYLEESLNYNERSIKGDVTTIAGIIYNMMDGEY